MFVNTFIIYFALAAFTKASFTPPAGLPNGVYAYDPVDGVHTTIDGKPVTSRDLNSSSTDPSVSVAPRELGNSAKFSPRWTAIHCDNTIISSLDYASAVLQLQGQCDGTTKLPKKNIYALYGDAMAFICVYKKDTICRVGEATKNANEGTDMMYAYNELNKQCSATLVAQKSVNRMDGYNRVSNSIVFGFTTSTSKAC
ncbi:hypothetical protein CJF30_00004390 [Rutstroemia sp. NJR-2017a BBW]|nr:hypothetical protein CJF30_00004390 [Rutstroemia sp. NJR-2017a BBW]